MKLCVNVRGWISFTDSSVMVGVVIVKQEAVCRVCGWCRQGAVEALTGPRVVRKVC